MLITFLTVLSTIWVVLWLGGLALTFFQYSQMTPLQQYKATVTLDPIGGVGFLLCVAWLITRCFV